MKTNPSTPNHLLADPGKVLQRISDGQIFGSEIYLSGKKLDEPLLELSEHFTEIDAPEEYKEQFKNN